MRHLGRVAALVIAGLIGATPVAAGQSGCLPTDAAGQSLFDWVSDVALGTDSTSVANRAAFGIEPTTPSRLSFVTDTRTCEKAADALSRELEVFPPNGRLVHVIRTAKQYIVEDPTVMYRDRTRAMVFDTKWRLVSKFIS